MTEQQFLNPYPEILQCQNRINQLPNAPVYLGEIFVQIIYGVVIIPDMYISNFGRAYNLRTWTFMTQATDKDGYKTINIKVENKFKRVKVHRIMMMSFSPIYNPEKFVVNHLDGIVDHNWINNLEWTTVMGNTRHAWDNDMNHNIGEGNIKTKISDADAHQICKYLEQGLKPCEICDAFNVYDKQERMRLSASISSISHGKSRRNISSQYNIPGTSGQTRYSEQFAYLVCQFLKEGDKFTYGEIMDYLEIPKEDRKFFKVYIDDLIRGRTAKNVTSNYELKKPRVDPPEY